MAKEDRQYYGYPRIPVRGRGETRNKAQSRGDADLEWGHPVQQREQRGAQSPYVRGSAVKHPPPWALWYTARGTTWAARGYLERLRGHEGGGASAERNRMKKVTK